MCELCDIYNEKRDIKTKIHHENSLCIVVDCATCKVPMIILKRHAKEPNARERLYMEQIAKALFDTDIKKMWDDRMRSIKGHYHVHIRRKKK